MQVCSDQRGVCRISLKLCYSHLSGASRILEEHYKNSDSPLVIDCFHANLFFLKLCCYCAFNFR